MGSRSRYRPNRNTDTLSSSLEYPIVISEPPVQPEPSGIDITPWEALNAVGGVIHAALSVVTENTWTPEGAKLIREPLAHAIWASRYVSSWVWGFTGVGRWTAERVPRAKRELPATCRFWGDMVVAQLRLAYLTESPLAIQGILAAGLECCLAVRDVIEKQVPGGSWEFDLTSDRLDEVSPLGAGCETPTSMISPYFAFMAFAGEGMPDFLRMRESPAEFCQEIVDAMCKKGLVVRERVA